MSAKRRNPQPLNAPRLEEMALAYVARFATTQAKLRAYLLRKLRERGWEEDGDAPVDELVARYAELGYVDDESWARMKAGSLMRRGYGARRVQEALGHAGIGAEVREDLRPSEASAREAAQALARRRRLGPFARDLLDRPAREKHVAAMLRAGHSLDISRRIIDAPDPESVQEWVDEAFEEQG